MELTDFLSRLDGVKKRGKFFTARVPGREDKDPSLSVWEEGGWIKLKDWGGKCTDADIVRAMGLENKDLRIASAPEHATFTYTDQSGKPIFHKRRFVENGKKTFAQIGTEGQKTLAHLNGHAKTLYKFSLLPMAISKGLPVYINEGEKACDAMYDAMLELPKEKRFAVTCQPGGADVTASKWHDHYTETLRGAHVIIVADRDETGEGYARSLYIKLKPVCASVTVVRSKVDEPKADAFDHFSAGFTVEDFVTAPDLMPSLGFSVEESEDENFEPIKLEYLIKPYLPEGKAILLDADGGTGKSSLALAVAAGLSVGSCVFGDCLGIPVKTLYVGVGEDSTDELKTIYYANGGRKGYIKFLNEPGLVFDKEGIQKLEHTIRDHKISLVIIDALMYFMPLRNANEAFEVMQVMRPLMGVYARTGASGIHIRHTGKQSKDNLRAASDLGFGSVQFRNSHRGQLVMRFHPEDRGLVVVTDEKGSILVPRGEPFAFRRRELEIQFVAEFENPFDRAQGNRTTAQAEVELWLSSNVPSDTWMAARELESKAEGAGITPRGGTWTRAKKSVLVTRKFADGWNVMLASESQEGDR